MECSSKSVHVALLCSPGIGHLIPVMALANQLATHHRIRATILLVTATGISHPDSNYFNHRGDLVRIIELPPVDIDHLVNPSTRVVTRICLMLREAVPVIRFAIAAMDTRPDALIVDIFSTDALDVAAEFDMPKYVYVASTPKFTALMVYCPIFDQEIEGEYVDQKEYLTIPGCTPLRPVDVVDPMLDRCDQQYEEFVKMGKQIPLCDGILSNFWEDLDRTTLKAFRENEALKSVAGIPIYCIGPLTRPAAAISSDYMAWLDRQPNDSVIFVSFGSGGILSIEQITELALGLELSQQRFLWVVRTPTGGRVDDAFLSSTGSTDSDGQPNFFLSDGFLARTSDVGLMLPNWAEQVGILNHPAVGGFLSHCGWNSVLESITSGVPMIAWPLYAEQRMNAAFLADEAGVAVRTRELPSDCVIGREEIGELVRALMEGEAGKGMREKVKGLKKSAEIALASGGSSHKALSDVVSQIRDNGACRPTM